jgi:hypothetical protein
MLGAVLLPGTLALFADCNYYAATAVSLVYDHDLDLRNQLRGGPRFDGGQIALGSDGAWYPLHPILTPIAAATLLVALGVLAFVRGRDAAGGVHLRLSVAAKLTHLFLLPFGVRYALACRGWNGAGWLRRRSDGAPLASLDGAVAHAGGGRP